MKEKEHETTLTMQETEQLCRLYMECRLSVLEETELCYLLQKLPYTSPSPTAQTACSSSPAPGKSSSKRFPYFILAPRPSLQGRGTEYSSGRMRLCRRGAVRSRGRRSAALSRAAGPITAARALLCISGLQEECRTLQAEARRVPKLHTQSGRRAEQCRYRPLEPPFRSWPCTQLRYGGKARPQLCRRLPESTALCRSRHALCCLHCRKSRRQSCCRSAAPSIRLQPRSAQCTPPPHVSVAGYCCLQALLRLRLLPIVRTP